MKTLTNSLICTNQSGKVGIIGDMLGNGIMFYKFDTDGNTGEGELVQAETLKQATRDQIPASRMLPDAVLDELGYEAAPKAQSFSSRFEKPE